MSEKTTNKRHFVSPFILKIYQIMENPEYQDLIQWSKDGDMFYVLDIAGFTTKVLPVFFKHKNYSSFVRQLNMYGFRKTKSEVSDNCFMHSIFKKSGKKDLIKVKKVKKDSLDEEDAGYEEQDYGSLDHNVRGSFMPRSSHRKGSASMLPLTDGSNPQRQLIELNSRFDSIFSAAEDLKKQADLQAEQLKQIRSEIQSTKELNDVRHEMLQQALMKGLMNAFNQSFNSPARGLYGFEMPFASISDRNSAERNMLGATGFPFLPNYAFGDSLKNWDSNQKNELKLKDGRKYAEEKSHNNNKVVPKIREDSSHARKGDTKELNRVSKNKSSAKELNLKLEDTNMQISNV